MKKKLIVRVLDTVGVILALIIAALLIVVIIFNSSGHTIFIGDKTIAWVLTDSMEPLIPAKSYILIQKIDTKDIEVGQIIIFKSDDPTLNGANNTHRVVEIVGDNEEFVTKGDHNLSNDSYTAKAANVLGVYQRDLPVLTAFGRFMSTQVGIIITITVIAGLMMAIYLPGIIKATKRRSAEAEKIRQEKLEEAVKAEVERLMAENAATDTAEKEHTETPINDEENQE